MAVVSEETDTVEKTVVGQIIRQATDTSFFLEKRFRLSKMRIASEANRKPRLLEVTVQDHTAAFTVLKQYKDFAKLGYKVFNDKTPNQQKIVTNLRNQLEEENC